jgi:hypothetical protein
MIPMAPIYKLINLILKFVSLLFQLLLNINQDIFIFNLFNLINMQFQTISNK